MAYLALLRGRSTLRSTAFNTVIKQSAAQARRQPSGPSTRPSTGPATRPCTAQCGWVLWEISSPTTKNPDRTYDKIDAEATNEACKQRAEVAIQHRTLQARRYGWTVTRGDANRVNFTKVGDPDPFFVDFQCWPDTVDPRGPKGK